MSGRTIFRGGGGGGGGGTGYPATPAPGISSVWMIPSLLYRVDRIIDFDLFVMMAIRDTIKEKVSRASVNQAPYVFTARGVQRHPSSEHLTSYLECLRTSAALAAVPAETPASKMIEGLSGEVTVLS